MKKLYFKMLALLMLTSYCSTAQQVSYTEALEQFFNSSIGDSTGVTNTFQKLNPTNFQLKITTDQQTVNISPDSMQYYLENRYDKDLLEAIQPYFEKHVSADELMELTALRNDKRIKLAGQHIEEAFRDTACASRILGSLMSSFFSSIFNPDAQMISIPSNCPKKYYESVSEMCNTTEVGDKVANLLGPLGDSQSMGDAIKMKLLSTILGSQLPSLLTNIYWGHVTQDDLDAMNEMFKKSCFVHVNEATAEVLSEWPKISGELMTKMAQWATGTNTQQK